MDSMHIIHLWMLMEHNQCDTHVQIHQVFRCIYLLGELLNFGQQEYMSHSNLMFHGCNLSIYKYVTQTLEMWPCLLHIDVPEIHSSYLGNCFHPFLKGVAAPGTARHWSHKSICRHDEDKITPPTAFLMKKAQRWMKCISIPSKLTREAQDN